MNAADVGKGCRDAEAAVWATVDRLDGTLTAIAGTSWDVVPIRLVGGVSRPLRNVLRELAEQLDAEIGRRNTNAV